MCNNMDGYDKDGVEGYLYGDLGLRSYEISLKIMLSFKIMGEGRYVPSFRAFKIFYRLFYRSQDRWKHFGLGFFPLHDFAPSHDFRNT